MGRVIICRQQTASGFYRFHTTGIQISTVEELCYTIQKDYDSIGEELLEPSFTSYLQEVLKVELKTNQVEQESLLQRIQLIFNACTYFDTREKEPLLKKIENFLGLSKSKQKLFRANEAMKREKYKEAMYLYRCLVSDEREIKLSNEELGQIYHNMAVIKAYSGAFSEAEELFYKAYEISSSRKSYEQYQNALKLIDYDTTYKGGFDNHLLQYFNLNEILDLKKQGKLQEYYRMMDLMLEQVKQRYRKYSF